MWVLVWCSCISSSRDISASDIHVSKLQFMLAKFFWIWMILCNISRAMYVTFLVHSLNLLHRYIVAHLKLDGRQLGQQITKFLAMSDTPRIYYTSLLAIYGCCSQCFSCIIPKCLLASIMSSNLCGPTFMHVHMQFRHFYLTPIYPWHHSYDKCIRLSPSL